MVAASYSLAVKAGLKLFHKTDKLMKLYGHLANLIILIKTQNSSVESCVINISSYPTLQQRNESGTLLIHRIDT